MREICQNRDTGQSERFLDMTMEERTGRRQKQPDTIQYLYSSTTYWLRTPCPKCYIHITAMDHSAGNFWLICSLRLWKLSIRFHPHKHTFYHLDYHQYHHYYHHHRGSAYVEPYLNFIFDFISASGWQVYKVLFNTYKATTRERRQEDYRRKSELERHKLMLQERMELWLFCISSSPPFPRLWHIKNPWPPLNPCNSGKSSRGQPSSWLKFLLFIAKPSPFVSSSAKKTLLLKFFPLILAQICLRCTKLWCSYSELTRRRNENKRSLKAMNHVCHHQRGGWCGSLLGSHKPLEVMEELLIFLVRLCLMLPFLPF